MNEPDVPFTLDDLKMLVERANKEQANMPIYRDVLDYVMERGTGTLKNVETLKFLKTVLNGYHSTPEGYEAAEYEVAFRKVYEGRNHLVNSKKIMGLRSAGVPAEEAARMVDQGMSDRAIIAVSQEGTEKALAEGWL